MKCPRYVKITFSCCDSEHHLLMRTAHPKNSVQMLFALMSLVLCKYVQICTSYHPADERGVRNHVM
jgi:hypothetical protein